MLKIINITKKYGGLKAANNCSFVVEPVKITALIGPNGSGKSTIFNLISGLEKPDSGKILFKNKDLNNQSVEDISNLGVARLFQQSKIFKNLTVKENLLVAMDNIDMNFWRSLFLPNKIEKIKEKKIMTLLGKIKMDHLVNRVASDLSFGQQRLIEIARTILNPHELIILDEPVAGIAPQLRKVITQLLIEEKKNNKSVFFIEHDMSFTLKLADKIIVIDAGQVIAEGTPKEISQNKKVLEAYLGD